MRVAIRRFLCREVQTDAEDVTERRRTDDSSRDGQLEDEGEEADSGAHEEGERGKWELQLGDSVLWPDDLRASQ